MRLYFGVTVKPSKHCLIEQETQGYMHSYVYNTRFLYLEMHVCTLNPLTQ